MSAALSIFGFRGRLSRGGFWWRTILIWAIFIAANALLTNSLGSISTWLFNPVAILAMAALAVRRLHDRNFSGRWLLMVLLPVVGAAWLFWQLAFSRGVSDNNRWGNDPLASNADFLVVR
jgi:uncharacterized membrane protein YhaH (DUF805 family)